MRYYQYKKEKLQNIFPESKICLVRIRECLKRNPEGEDEIINLINRVRS